MNQNGMFRSFALKPSNFAVISQFTGRSQAELDLKYMDDVENNRVTVYTMQISCNTRSL